MQPTAETGQRLALLVATSAYSDPDLRQLRSPGHDADQLAAVLRDPRIGGFDVQMLINPASGEVQEGIEDFCTDRHPDDQLLIYLSCHGVLDSYGRLYYAAANTRRQRLAATAVASAWLNERLEDCRARRQILVLDCCHSGAFAKGTKGDADLALQHRFEPHGRGRVVLTASRSTEYSFEGGQASGEGVPSIFTHAIVTGLRTGEADRDKDGLITVTDLYQYVYDNVRAAEPRQTPELWTYGAEGNLLVAHSVRGAVIEPELLPEDLRVTLESPRRRVRETGVGELADLLDGPAPGLVLAARQALERIAEEDHPQVAALARIATNAPAGTAADQVRRELTDRAHREELERQEAARREAEEKAHQEAEPTPEPLWTKTERPVTTPRQEETADPEMTVLPPAAPAQAAEGPQTVQPGANGSQTAPVTERRAGQPGPAIAEAAGQLRRAVIAQLATQQGVAVAIQAVVFVTGLLALLAAFILTNYYRGFRSYFGPILGPVNVYWGIPLWVLGAAEVLTAIVGLKLKGGPRGLRYGQIILALATLAATVLFYPQKGLVMLDQWPSERVEVVLLMCGLPGVITIMLLAVSLRRSTSEPSVERVSTRS